jgi:hypothetical protein
MSTFAPQPIQNNEPSKPPTHEQSTGSKGRSEADMIGFWDGSFGALKFRIAFKNNGAYETLANGITNTGTWSYSSGILTTNSDSGDDKSTVKWTNDDAFEVTVSESNDSPELIGHKIFYRRIK